jgi:poly-gamma-glutamate capsule biosynthesis protein CapA/YwtB (metallophosphatase superfamily)
MDTHKHLVTNKMKLVFVGDIMQHPKQLEYESARDFTYKGVFDSILDIFEGADAVIGNLETNLANTYNAISMPPGKFCAPVEFIDVLKEVGFTHLSVNNNHMYDCGKAGHIRTICMIQDYGMSAIDGRCLDIIKGNRVELFNFTTHINDMKHYAYELPNNLEDNKNCDFRIALPHWGGQYTINPDMEQETYEDILIGNGYNMIIGSGPHTTHEVKIYNADEDIIISGYSLGDFLSDHEKKPSTDEGLVLSVTIENLVITEVIVYHTETFTDPDGQSAIKIIHKDKIL